MNFIALQMLTYDKAKYLGLIFAVAFSTFLMAQQASIFSGLMARTASQINDVEDAHVWVMDPYTQYFDEVKALPDDAVYRVRGVEGVDWAVPIFKGQPRAKAYDGNFRVVVMLGVDDATLVGAPRKMVLGSYENLREPESILIDRVGYEFFFPNQPYSLGKTLEMNEHRVKIVGIFNSSAPFQNFPILYSRYRNAIQYVGRERNLLSFVLGQSGGGCHRRGNVPQNLCRHWPAGKDRKGLQLADDLVLHPPHRNSGEFRDHDRHRSTGRDRCGGTDLLHLHDREPEAVRGAEGDRRDQHADRRDDYAAGADGGHGRLLARVGDDGGLF
jgi:hypothetical protein